MSGKFSQLATKVSTARRRFAQRSLAARAATYVAVGLCCLVLVAWTIFLLDKRSVPWRHSLSLGRVITVCVLLIVIPLVIYRALRLWLEGDAPPFPDLNYAWRAGLESLENHGLDVRTLPVFLVLGSHDENEQQDLMNAAGLEFRCRGIPEGPAAIHWYANPKAIFIHCQDASCLSALAAMHAKRSTDAISARLLNPESATGLAPAEPVGERMPIVPGSSPMALSSASPPPMAPAPPPPAPGPAAAAAAPAGKAGRGTITLDQFLSQQQAAAPAAASAPAPAPAAEPAARGKGSERGTLLLEPVKLGGDSSSSVTSLPSSPPTQAAPIAERAAPGGYSDPDFSLRPQVEQEQMRRLKFVCQLLRRVRQPLCGINGVLVLVSFKAIQEGDRATEAVGRAIKADLRTVQASLQLRAPVTALVTGLEQESGFRELVRRVGPERAALQRFGRGFDVRSPAGTTELRSLSEHVTGAFEDWIYALFREQGSLTRPGNAHLYSLLGKVR
ncbi:MAG TPA: type VI secretion protein IcmF/TssM N-terminal domain-containing protein, partial [Pirellulales bacterium]|nr:type VI secretion protein IcmF/TssM N-terminal domain-containing protein [Pirellulales bacterium]